MGTLTGDEEGEDVDEEGEGEEADGGEGEDENRRTSESVPTKIKPIPKYTSFFILSHTNG